MAEYHMMEKRKLMIKLEDGSLIKGTTNIFAEPNKLDYDTYSKDSGEQGTFYTRVSDIFTKGQNPFIVVTDAVTEGLSGRVLIINKNKILWVCPED
jgi:hypothetical protein